MPRRSPSRPGVVRSRGGPPLGADVGAGGDEGGDYAVAGPLMLLEGQVQDGLGLAESIQS
jgi:hypothetical protein